MKSAGRKFVVNPPPLPLTLSLINLHCNDLTGILILHLTIFPSSIKKVLDLLYQTTNSLVSIPSDKIAFYKRLLY